MLYTGFIDYKTLREDVLQTAYRKGMKIVDIAEAIGYNQQTVYSFLNGKKTSKPLAVALIKLFDLNERKYNKL